MLACFLLGNTRAHERSLSGALWCQSCDSLDLGVAHLILISNSGC